MHAAGQKGGLVRRNGEWVPAGGEYSEPELASQETDGDGSGRPWKTATRAEWDEYARQQGIDNPEEYASKDALIEALG